jgi:hypothetical protein
MAEKHFEQMYAAGPAGARPRGGASISMYTSSYYILAAHAVRLLRRRLNMFKTTF